MSEEERELVEKNIVFEDTLLEITPELMKKTILKQDKEIERLNNIIKEVKDYFEDLEIFAPSRDIKYDILDIIEGSENNE